MIGLSHTKRKLWEEKMIKFFINIFIVSGLLCNSVYAMGEKPPEAPETLTAEQIEERLKSNIPQKGCITDTKRVGTGNASTADGCVGGAKRHSEKPTLLTDPFKTPEPAKPVKIDTPK